MEAVDLILELTYSWGSQCQAVSGASGLQPKDLSSGDSISHPFLTPHKCDAVLLVSSCLGIKNSEAEPLLVHPIPSLQSDSTLDVWSQGSLPRHCPRLAPGLDSSPHPVLCLAGCRVLQWSPLLGFGSDCTVESGEGGPAEGMVNHFLCVDSTEKESCCH